MSRASRCACGKVRSSARATAPTIAAPKEITALLGIPHTLLGSSRTIRRDRGQTVRTGLSPRAHAESVRRLQSRFQAGQRCSIGRKSRGQIMLPQGIMPGSLEKQRGRAYRSSAARIPARISPIFSSRYVTTNWSTRCFRSAQCKRATCGTQARRLGLPVADRQESQDICFGDYKAWWNPMRVRTSLVAVMW